MQSFIHALKVSWIKKIVDPLNQGPWKVLISNHLDASGGEKLWYLSPSGLKQLARKLIQFFLARRHFTLCSIRDNPSTVPEEILSQPLWLNSEIKIGGKPVLYQHWAKTDVFFINDSLKNEGGFLSLEQFQDKYGIISNFLKYNGLLKAIPMKFKEVSAVNNKLEKVCDRYVTVLNNTLKPTKPLYKMLLEKHIVHPTKSQEK